MVFCQLYYNIKQIDFIFLCFCTVIDHRWRHTVWRTKSHALDCVSYVLFCSSHATTSSVIYYSTDARKNEIYLLNSSIKVRPERSLKLITKRYFSCIATWKGVKTWPKLYLNLYLLIIASWSEQCTGIAQELWIILNCSRLEFRYMYDFHLKLRQIYPSKIIFIKNCPHYKPWWNYRDSLYIVTPHFPIIERCF